MVLRNPSISKRIETAANLSIVVAAALVVFVLVKDHLLTNRIIKGDIQQAKGDSNRKTEPLVGAPVELAGVDWPKNGQTLLIVISKGCHYCTESASFYKKIAQAANARNDFQVIAVFPHSVAEGREYLAEIQVPITEVRQSSIKAIGVRGTPTIILVDSAGVVKETWLGRLSADREAEILKKLGCQECS